MDIQKKEAIRSGVIARLKRDGKFKGTYVTADKVCANQSCGKSFKPCRAEQIHCSMACRKKYRTKDELKKARSFYVSEHRRNRKVRAVEYKGGACKVCGYNRCLDALDFHHLDPAEKDFPISGTGNTRSWERMAAELDKCILLCTNCHRELHAGLIQVP